MPDAGSSIVAYSFAFEPPLDRCARLFAVVPTRSYVRVDQHGFEAVYGLWRVATTWANVAEVERTGPYRAWKVAGPARVSVADRGLTMAATTTAGACLKFRRSVGGVEPLGLVRHPALTLGVDDLDTFVADVRARIAAAPDAAGVAAPPRHASGTVVAALRAVWRWRRRDVDHVELKVDRLDTPSRDRAGDADDQPIENATGPTFHRRYRRTVDHARLDAEQAMAAMQSDLSVLADDRLSPFIKVRGASGTMAVGDRYLIDIAGPWKGAVEVIEFGTDSLRLSTLEGHMESGVLEMRTSSEPGTHRTTLTIESWARSHDRALSVLYHRLGFAKALQAEMWSTACDRFAVLVDGEPSGRLDIVTEHAPQQRRGRRHPG